MTNIVCLCGSVRFRKEFFMVNLVESIEGNIVLMPGFGPEPITLTDEHKATVDRIYFEKIDMCDYVIVIDVNDYEGESTKREIEYAQQQGKTILYWSNLKDEIIRILADYGYNYANDLHHSRIHYNTWQKDKTQ